MVRFECEKHAARMAGGARAAADTFWRSEDLWQSKEDISHASNFRSALRCVLPLRVYHQVRVQMHLYLARRSKLFRRLAFEPDSRRVIDCCAWGHRSSFLRSSPID